MIWRKFLAPLAGMWWVVTSARNVLFNHNILYSKSFPIPIISVGNLSTGGTGKTPHTAYLLEFLKNRYRTAVLSRGYGRKTKGFLVANYDSTAKQIGDEPSLFFNRFRNRIIVAVGEDRIAAIRKLLKQFELDAIILDDAFQHRRLRAGFQILLTDYSQLYVDDYLLPMGNLRESYVGARRADAIIVTKCPEEMSDEQKQEIAKKLQVRAAQPLFFSRIVYGDTLIHPKYPMKLSESRDCHVLLVTGIANPKPMEVYAKSQFNKVSHLSFPDHHDFKPDDIAQISMAYDEMQHPAIILTTEKDYMRLKHESALSENLYYLPITIAIDRQSEFDEMIENYVQQN
ncbi:MAG: tetraacyldisaccharide 4'-kinase [Weeksellaceae bacterium]|nr:tetraacyldisaccharide 4'-kinase [Weeksellaceae bacterium]